MSWSSPMVCKYCGNLCEAVPGGVQCDTCSPPPKPEDPLADLRTKLVEAAMIADALRMELEKVTKERDALVVNAKWSTKEAVKYADEVTVKLREERDELRALVEKAKRAIQNGGQMTDGNFGCDPFDIAVLQSAIAEWEARKC